MTDAGGRKKMAEYPLKAITAPFKKAWWFVVRRSDWAGEKEDSDFVVTVK